eukprot:SAG11_NODE_121_length_15851_cov_6.082466_13_plen_185_part_00
MGPIGACREQASCLGCIDACRDQAKYYCKFDAIVWQVESITVEIAAEQEAADADHKALLREIKTAKKSKLVEMLMDRDLDHKGKQNDLKARLKEALKADKEEADTERREAALTEQEKLAREIEEQKEQKERERLEAEKALAEQEAEEAAKSAMFAPYDAKFETLNVQARAIPKKNLKKHRQNED